MTLLSFPGGSGGPLARLAAAACAAALMVPAAARAQETIDRPVTIYVAGTAGGGIDLFARLLGRHIGRHIPGNPTVTVQVMPGAGGIRAANFLAQPGPPGRHRDDRFRRAARSSSR